MSLTQTTTKTYSGLYGWAQFSVQLCAEGFRLDEALDEAVENLKKSPGDQSVLELYRNAAAAYFTHRRGVWSKKQNRHVGACPHCRVYCLPRWVGVGSVTE